MEALMSFVLVTLALGALVWFGLKSIKAERQQVALQPIRIREQQRRNPNQQR